MTEDLAEDPFLEEEVERRKRDGQHAKQDVGQRQIGDEAVGDGLHGLVLGDDEYDEHVTQQAHHKDDGVQRVNVHLHGRVVPQVVRLSAAARPITAAVVVRVVAGAID